MIIIFTNYNTLVITNNNNIKKKKLKSTMINGLEELLFFCWRKKIINEQKEFFECIHEYK